MSFQAKLPFPESGPSAPLDLPFPARFMESPLA